MGSYAGVDWAGDKHDVLVCDEAGGELLAATFAHDEKGLRALCRALLRLEVELVAIERPDGLLVERLLDAGLRVLPVHPKQVAASRARFRAAGGKSDRFDAFVLCELARTDNHRFRVLEQAIAGSDTLTAADRQKLHTRLRAKPELNRYLRTTNAGRLRINKTAISAEQRLDGKFLLRCSDPTLTAEDIALGYKQLLQIERAWRDMKTTLDLRPVHHRKEDGSERT
jgi:Transposase